MSCGMLAMMAAGVEVECYDAYEIDKYAIKTAIHNFPMIRQHGDVFTEDFTKYDGVDFLVGGSPCTYWSIAQTKNRETVASGLGWELFSQYVRALHESKPKYFIYENNKSMSKEIRASIDEAFGFEAVCINSALVSAQNRQRLYWVGKRNADGTYSKVNVEQPQDRGILLKDVLDGAAGSKPLSEREMDYMVRGTNGKYSDRWTYLQKPNEADKALCLTANIHKGVPYNVCAEPVCVASRGRYIGEGSAVNQHFEARPNGKTNTLTSVEKDNRIAEPVSNIFQVGAMPMPNGELSTSAGFRVYSPDAKGRYLCANGGGSGAKTGLYALPVEEPMRVREATKAGEAQIEMGACVDMTQPNSKTRRGRSMDEKSNCLVTSPQYYQYCAKLCYAVPCEWDESGYPVKAVSCSDGKVYPVYKVESGQITIKDKQYPIKLVDGYYIIRKLTVSECMRLQTVPEWYDFSCVSNSQAYKMLGNGWTVEVIAHLIRACIRE